MENFSVQNESGAESSTERQQRRWESRCADRYALPIRPRRRRSCCRQYRGRLWNEMRRACYSSLARIASAKQVQSHIRYRTTPAGATSEDCRGCLGHLRRKLTLRSCIRVSVPSRRRLRSSAARSKEPSIPTAHRGSAECRRFSPTVAKATPLFHIPDT
jgi:hypothetical protein